MQTDIINKFFKNKGWSFSQSPNESIFFFGITGKNGNFQCIIDLNKNDYGETLILLSIYGATIPEEKREIVIKLINRINYELLFGNFEMNIETGEVRLRSNILLNSSPLTEGMLDQNMMTNIITMDQVLPMLNGIIYRGMEEEEAMELFE